MNAIVNTAPRQLAWRELPTPTPSAGQVRIRTAACGICATDLEMIAGWARTGFPAVPGHEWAGVVDAVGQGVDAKLVGKRCVADNVLADGGEVGFEHYGGYGQYLITEARNLHLLPADFPLHIAVLIEPLAVCVRGLRRLRPSTSENALIFGDGPIGLLMLMLVKASGGDRVALVGGRAPRLQLARELGADHVVNYHDAAGDLARVIEKLPGAPFPAVVEASGSAEAMSAAMNTAAFGGKVLVLGDYADAHADFRWNQILHRELELIGSNASGGAWPEAVRLATSGAMPLEKLITRRFPARQFDDAMVFVKDRRQAAVKVVLEWELN
jgi:2-desacetyl-2-hydroxyethyl bacteriochlorophyllide A dehydrogenase